jgi:hypothetical protein
VIVAGKRYPQHVLISRERLDASCQCAFESREKGLERRTGSACVH